MKHGKRSQLFCYIYEFLKRIAVFFFSFSLAPKTLSGNAICHNINI